MGESLTGIKGAAELVLLWAYLPASVLYLMNALMGEKKEAQLLKKIGFYAILAGALSQTIAIAVAGPDPAMEMINPQLFTLSMFIYLGASLVYVFYSALKDSAFGELIGKVASSAVVIGVMYQSAALALRWVESYKFGDEYGHAPLSNMYESMVFFSWCAMLVYIVFERKYKLKVLGVIVAPLGFLGIAVVSLFGNADPSIKPLVPALKSIWLEIHVMTCFIGYGAFCIAFGASIIYLIRKGQEEDLEPSTAKRIYEWLGWGAAIGLLYVVADYFVPSLSVGREYLVYLNNNYPNMMFLPGKSPDMVDVTELTEFALYMANMFPTLTFYNMIGATAIGAAVGAVVGYLFDIVLKSVGSSAKAVTVLLRGTALFVASFFAFKYMLHNVSGDSWILLRGSISAIGEMSTDIAKVIGASGINQAAQDITLYSVVGAACILLAAFYSSKGIKDIPSRLMEEISYKSTGIGFPFLTAGIITGAIWANEAWGTYWSWDPKETWSLITWFMYAAFLHARYTKGWRGRRMAVLSIIGFVFVIFTYWGVNFLLSGLHAYGSS